MHFVPKGHLKVVGLQAASRGHTPATGLKSGHKNLAMIGLPFDACRNTDFALAVIGEYN